MRNFQILSSNDSPGQLWRLKRLVSYPFANPANWLRPGLIAKGDLDYCDQG